MNPPRAILHDVAQKVAGHIQKPMSLQEIAVAIDSNDYNAELMLQHLLLWAAKHEQQQ